METAIFDYKKENVFSPTVKLENGKIIRLVSNINEYPKLIEIITKNGLFGKHIVETKILSYEDNLLEHKYITTPIIYSGEYTESMNYDIARLTIKLCKTLLKDNIYAFDLLPNNYTYTNGNWILYDFEALSLNSYKMINQIRSMFKTYFSSMELTKIIPRKELKEYYLNRMQTEKLMSIIPIKNWLVYFIQMEICLLICKFGFFKTALNILDKILCKYEKHYTKKYYDYNLTEEKEKIFEDINNLINKENCNQILLIGEAAREYAIYDKNKDIIKFVYTDDCEKCDEYYNYIHKNELNQIMTALIYPLVNDENISESYIYRAIYDDFAKYRLNSNCTIIFNYDDILNQNKNETELLINLTDFTTQELFIITTKEETKFIEDTLLKYFKECKTYLSGKNRIIHATDKYNKMKYPNKTKYLNVNRGPDAKKHTKKIKEIIDAYKNKSV